MPKRMHSPGAKEVRLAGGEFGGRRLKGGPGIRPLPARVRSALFNILGFHLEGMRILDLFAGTGAVALEALGRGAASAVLVDKTHSSVAAIRANIQTLGLAGRAQAVQGDVLVFLNTGRFSGEGFDMVFVGPPYDRDLCLPTLERISPDILAPADALVVVHASPREALPDAVGCLARYDLRTYGDCLLHFYRNAECGPRNAE